MIQLRAVTVDHGEISTTGVVVIDPSMLIDPRHRSCSFHPNQNLQITWICEESARFWKVEFQLAWPNAACVIVKQCKLLAEDPGGRPRNTDLRVMSREQGSQLARMAQEFDMEKNLSPELIEV